MANKLISLSNLQTYDNQIKDFINGASSVSIKKVLWDGENNQIKFYKDPEATLASTPDYTIDIAADAEDISYDNTTSGLSATDVQGAIDEVADSAAGDASAKTIWFTDNSAGQSDYAKIYKIWQGAHAPDAVTDPATLIGTINIPLDKVLQDASIVTITFNSADGKLYDGVTDVTALIVGPSGTATADDAGKYLKMEMQNVTDPLYVNLQDFVDLYIGSTNDEATVTIGNDNSINVAINKISATKSIYTAASAAVYAQVEAGDTFDENETYYTEDDGVYTVDSTVTADNFDAKVAAGLYTQTSPAVAEVTVKAKLDELNYITATTAEINALFS